jgi:hypothetical protein
VADLASELQRAARAAVLGVGEHALEGVVVRVAAAAAGPGVHLAAVGRALRAGAVHLRAFVAGGALQQGACRVGSCDNAA